MESQRLMDYLMDVEVAAEDVLSDKQQVVDLDARRNRNREAMNALKNSSSDAGEEVNTRWCVGSGKSSSMIIEQGKVKVCFGNMFIKFPKESTKSMIQRDQEQLEQEINDLRKGLKAKVNRLNDLQGKPELRGYNLSPLTGDELKAINTILKR